MTAATCPELPLVARAAPAAAHAAYLSLPSAGRVGDSLYALAQRYKYEFLDGAYV